VALKEHDFRERLAFSEGIEDTQCVLDGIANMVPNAIAVRRATESEDKSGTDYWIERSHDLPAISVDVKRRSFCPIDRWKSDDACIETTSVYLGPGNPPWRDENRVKPGWSVDFRKRTDYIAYTWPTDGGTRYWIVPFVPLCRAARVNWRAWAAQLGERPAKNNRYLTLNVYPSRQDIAAAMRAFMAGVA
jgi:hypothetical protein